MKRFVFIISILVCFVSKQKAQINLVPNYSFEDTVSTQMCFSQMILNKTKYWFNPSNTSPDYINTCANTYTANYPLTSTIPQTCYGHQYPKTGDAMAGIGTYVVHTTDSINYIAEYLSVKLNDTLKPGICYYGEFYAVLADVCEFNSNRLGMYLSQNTFSTSVGSFTNSIETQIQFDTTSYFTDTLNWVKISGSFTALGGETHLTIGSFKDGTHVKKIGSISGFTSLCNFTDNPHNIVYFYIDDVSLYECNSQSVKDIDYKYRLELYPNPANSTLNIKDGNQQLQNASTEIKNTLGQVVYVGLYSNQIDVSNLPQGIYFITINKKESKQTIKFVKD